MTPLLDPFRPTPRHPSIPWMEYLAIDIEERALNQSNTNAYANRAAIDYVAFLQYAGRRSQTPPFVAFDETRMRETLMSTEGGDDADDFDDAFYPVLALFKSETIRLMRLVLPAMSSIGEDIDFTAISNVYVEAAMGLPAAAGVFYGIGRQGHSDPFPTIVAPSLFNRINYGLRLRDYPSEGSLIESAERHSATVDDLVGQGRLNAPLAARDYAFVTTASAPSFR